ncbi:zinc finger BED domain-containing protein 4-like [Hydra vulgaris]|uniref:zinc finger BED domain-containing protein 4-like n=1 Tax=Hydra vulgaris TaxID=6087 RepID=UPI001F5F51C0|nr:zinc finger BED domain-containing protein 4-like [Hydra vulgaris]
MSSNRKTSLVRKYFIIEANNPRMVQCKICNSKVSRGSDDPKKHGLSGLTSHLKNHHPDIKLTPEKAENPKANEEADLNSNKRKAVTIFKMRSKKQRSDMLQSTIPNWVQASSKIDSNSEKGQKFHKSIFEMMILDLQPWSIVNDAGFLRHHALIAPNYEIASEKYYRSLLDPTYEKIKVALKEKLVQSEAENVSVCLDAWSSFHHGYLGMTVHFISKDWNRVKFCISCSPFDESHTAKNIFKEIKAAAEEWEISSKIGVCLRDNAANVKAAFNEPSCNYKSAGCLNHSLQLVIKKDLLSDPTINELIEKSRKLCSYASHSIGFYTELYRQQEIQMDRKDRLGLKNDVATRWNSTYYMLERILHLKPAIAATLLKFPSVGIEFSVQDWSLYEKVVRILSVFEEATKMLSGSDSCISSCIPIVTTIIKALETSGDVSVQKLKIAMKNAMEKRFSAIEKTEHYSVATLLNPKYKWYFFQSQAALQNAKHIVMSQMENFEPLEDELAPVTQIPSGDNEKNTAFSHIMSKIIAQSQTGQNEHSSSKMTREVLKNFLDCPMASHCLEFWKNYKKNATSKIKLALTKVAKKYLTPPPTFTDVERLFSTAGDILSNERNRLLAENLEKLLFCRENLAVVGFCY